MAVQHARIFCGALIVKCGPVIKRERRELPAKVSYNSKFTFLQPTIRKISLFSGRTGVTYKSGRLPENDGRIGRYI